MLDMWGRRLTCGCAKAQIGAGWIFMPCGAHEPAMERAFGSAPSGRGRPLAEAVRAQLGRCHCEESSCESCAPLVAALEGEGLRIRREGDDA